MITLKEIMSRHYEFVRPQETAQAALRKMEALNLIMLPVCENDRLVGVLDSTRAARRLEAGDPEASQAKVRDIMSAEMLTGGEQDNVQEIVQVMRQRGIPLLPVVDTERRILGVFSLGGPWRRGPKGAKEPLGAAREDRRG